MKGKRFKLPSRGIGSTVQHHCSEPEDFLLCVAVNQSRFRFPFLVAPTDCILEGVGHRQMLHALTASGQMHGELYRHCRMLE